ncbi:MAG: polyphenol oxidase family protein, partial [Polyangiaceae bacterium]
RHHCAMSTMVTEPFATSPLLDSLGFAHAFPERAADDDHLRSRLGLIAQDGIAEVRQVHGARVVLADDARGSEADAIVARSASGRIAVGVRVADCVPVLACAVDTVDVIAIPAGWRGIVLWVVRAGIEHLGGRQLAAAIGPSIGACCFEVGRDVADRIAQSAPHARVIAPTPVGASTGADKVYVNLRAAVRAQLRAAGLDDYHIDDVPGCTRHEATRFHSFRRDGKSSGRMLASIVTKPQQSP